MGHLIGAVIVSGAAGMFLPDALSALKMVAVFVLGVAVSAFVCQWRPGTEAAGWRLWLVAVLANPVMLLSLGFMAVDWECLLGLAWRWWKRRLAARRAV